MIQKDALHNIGLIARRIAKKEVVAFWFVFLPDKSYSPLSGSVTELINDQNKRVRMQALNINFLSSNTLRILYTKVLVYLYMTVSI